MGKFGKPDVPEAPLSDMVLIHRLVKSPVVM